MLDYAEFHKGLTRQLVAASRSGTLASSILLTGESGAGKRSIAHLLAAEILKISPERSLLNHPDLRSETAEELKVENLRRILAELSLSSFEQGKRLLIIESAELISISAANILLKIIEEPQSALFFILTSSNQAKIPLTIRSRCQQWHIRAPAADLLIPQIVDSEETNPSGLNTNQLTEIAKYSRNNAATLLRISSNAELWSTTKTAYESLMKHMDFSVLNTQFKFFSKNKEELPLFLFFMQTLVRNDLLRSLDSQTELRHYQSLAENLSLCEYYLFDRNLNTGYLLNQIFLSFIEKQEFNLSEFLAI